MMKEDLSLSQAREDILQHNKNIRSGWNKTWEERVILGLIHAHDSNSPT